MSFLSSLGSVLGGMAGNIDPTGGWLTNSSRESLNKNIGQTNLKLQQKYDKWTMEQDRRQEEWYQQLLYSLQNKEYFNLARRYATNTAKWAVDGLVAAGLNPILAAQEPNMSSNLGNAAPPAGSHGSRRGSVASHSAPAAGSSMASALTIPSVNAAKQSSADARVAVDTVGSRVQQAQANVSATESSTAKSNAEARLIDAQARRTDVETVNAAKTSGLGGYAGWLEKRLVNPLISGTTPVAERIGSSIGNAAQKFSDFVHGLSSGPNTAKSTAPVKRLKDGTIVLPTIRVESTPLPARARHENGPAPIKRNRRHN